MSAADFVGIRTGVVTDAGPPLMVSIEGGTAAEAVQAGGGTLSVSDVVLVFVDSVSKARLYAIGPVDV